jgi:hypothetical protein
MAEEVAANWDFSSTDADFNTESWVTLCSVVKKICFSPEHMQMK